MFFKKQNHLDYGEVEQALTDILDGPGRLLSFSKATYEQRHPRHDVIFNACIFVGEVQVWYGDIDLSTDSENLQKIADITGQEFTVTPENPYRFEGRFPPRADEKRVHTFTPRKET